MNRDLQLRDLRLALQAMKEAYPTIQEIQTPEMVVAFMGLLFDQYCTDHEIAEKVKVAHLVGLVDASIFVNGVLEPLEPTVVKKQQKRAIEKVALF